MLHHTARDRLIWCDAVRCGLCFSRYSTKP